MAPLTPTERPPRGGLAARKRIADRSDNAILHLDIVVRTSYALAISNGLTRFVELSSRCGQQVVDGAGDLSFVRLI